MTLDPRFFTLDPNDPRLPVVVPNPTARAIALFDPVNLNAVLGDDVSRNYAEVTVDIRPPVLGRVFTRDMLLTRVWGDSAYRDQRTIDVHIRHLREKLEERPEEPSLILTVPGTGYRFREP